MMMENNTSTKIAQREAGVDEFGAAFEAWLEASDYATGRDPLDEDMDINELFDDFRAHYRGQWASKEAFTRNALIDQGLGWSGADPAALDALRGYLDWERLARDFFQGYTMVDGYVFEDEV